MNMKNLKSAIKNSIIKGNTMKKCHKCVKAGNTKDHKKHESGESKKYEKKEHIKYAMKHKES